MGNMPYNILNEILNEVQKFSVLFSEVLKLQGTIRHLLYVNFFIFSCYLPRLISVWPQVPHRRGSCYGEQKVQQTCGR